eukprot:tig00001007_g6244.t1
MESLLQRPRPTHWLGVRLCTRTARPHSARLDAPNPALAPVASNSAGRPREPVPPPAPISGFVVYRDDPAGVPWAAFVPERLRRFVPHRASSSNSNSKASAEEAPAIALLGLEAALGAERLAALRAARGWDPASAARALADLSAEELAVALDAAFDAAALLSSSSSSTAPREFSRLARRLRRDLGRRSAPASDYRYGMLFRELVSLLDLSALSMILRRLGLLGQERPPTLQQVGDEHGLSAGRVRELEKKFKRSFPRKGSGVRWHAPALVEGARALEEAAPFLAPRGGEVLFRRGLCSSPGYHPASLLRLAELLGQPKPRLALVAFAVPGWPAALMAFYEQPRRAPVTLAMLEIALQQVLATGLATDSSVAAAFRAARDADFDFDFEFDPAAPPLKEDLLAARRALGAFRAPGPGGEFEGGILALSPDGRALRFAGPVGYPEEEAAPRKNSNSNERVPARLCHATALLLFALSHARGGSGPRLPLRVLLQSVERAASAPEFRRRRPGPRFWAAARAHALLDPAELAACIAACPAFEIDVWPEGGAPAPAPRELLEWLLEGPSRRPGEDGGALAAGDLYVRIAPGFPLGCLQDLIAEGGQDAAAVSPAGIAARLVEVAGLSKRAARARADRAAAYSPLLYRPEATASWGARERRLARLRAPYLPAWAVGRLSTM